MNKSLISTSIALRAGTIALPSVAQLEEVIATREQPPADIPVSITSTAGDNIETWFGYAQEERVGVWSKNPTDEEYRMNGIEWGLLTTMQYGDPELWGVDVTVSF